MSISMFRPFTVIVAISLLSIAVAQSKAAPIEALNFSNGSGYMAVNGALTGYTVGWKFTVNAPVQVTSLGYFDANTLGFNESHEVGIFSSGGALLTSATVAAGTTDPLVVSSGAQPANGFRYHTISPYFLTPGDYVIGGQIGANGVDDFWGNATATSTPGHITYTGGVYANGAGLPFPNTPADQGVSYFGPNFQFEPHVDTTALTLSGGVADGPFTPYVLGWDFTVTQAGGIDVTRLGVYDVTPGDNLSTSHQVGIYDSSSNLVVSGTVAANGPLIDGFRFAEVALTHLAAGSYTIAALYQEGSADQIITGGAGGGSSPTIFVAPGVTYDLGRYLESATLVRPTTASDRGIAYFGPTFQFVPEPSTFALLISALVGLVSLRRRYA